jgi:hypothetical protein
MGKVQYGLTIHHSPLTIHDKKNQMKNTVLYFLLAVTMVASCRRDDDHIFDKSPDDRINETLKTYQSALTSSATGWNADLVTGNGGHYRFYFLFNDSNRVQMYGDFDSSTASSIKESSYRLKALQQPSLIFDTYSHLHILADPDASVNGGFYGTGLKSDFEFRIDTVTADSIKLTGRMNGSTLRLKKATSQDRAVWDNKQVATGIVNFRSFWKFLLYFKRISYAGTQYELQFDTTVKKVTVSWTTGGQTQSVTRGYYYWANGIYFTDPVVNGAVNIPGFSVGAFNAGTQTLSATVNGAAAPITSFNSPVNPDVRSAVSRWWQFGAASEFYWISENGFHVNGVDDAYNIKSLKTDTSEYSFLLYRPNSDNIDAFIPIFLHTTKRQLFAAYGSWLRMNVTSSTGRAWFTEVGVRQGAPYPATGPAADTRTQMLHPNGYYFVQTSAYSYDMVSTADAKIWLTWLWVF